ncbi:MAG: hypothetical protein HY200_04330 [Nitrospirae bacterium]|nr:hypothetical protein [Nitrospirota bacterium]MBI3594162.1 hypothetical protein [Nitrospirota bacterium]
MLIILCVFGDAVFNLNRLEAKESVNPVSVDAIRVSPEAYDGKDLKVSGNVRSLSPARGKMDSEFIVLVLEGSKTEFEDRSHVLNVFSYYTPPVKAGARVVVSGIYHKAGYWAGSQHDHFLVAVEITPVVIN